MKPKQSIPKHLRLTVETFLQHFPNDEACLEYLREKRYPGGVTYCEKCQQDRKHHRVTGRPAYACDYCGSMISPMAGTIFEHSSTSLKLWFYAMYLMGSTRCGISAKQIQRETGVTYKTAWRMFRQIRSLLSEGDMQLEGSTVEMDEMYYGGDQQGPQRYARCAATNSKNPVVGIVMEQQARSGRVIGDSWYDFRAVLGIVHEHILPKTTVFTDEYSS